MANTFKSAASGSTTTIQTLYTCPGSTSGVVHAIYLSNIDGTNDARDDDAELWELLVCGECLVRGRQPLLSVCARATGLAHRRWRRR